MKVDPLHRPARLWTPSGCNSVVECNLAKVEVEGSNPFTRSSAAGHFGGLFCVPRLVQGNGPFALLLSSFLKKPPTGLDPSRETCYADMIKLWWKHRYFVVKGFHRLIPEIAFFIS